MSLYDWATDGMDEQEDDGRIVAAPVAPARQTAKWSRPDFDGAFTAAAQEYGVDADVLRAMAHVESRFNTQAVSPAGAVGVMQFMPATAKRFGIDPTDPVQAIFGAAAYMRANLEKFDGDYEKAVAGYNAGENHRAFNKGDDWRGRLPGETRNYIESVLGMADQIKQEPSYQPLPRDVRPSTAGAGRGLVNPPLAAEMNSDVADNGPKEPQDYRQMLADRAKGYGAEVARLRELNPWAPIESVSRMANDAYERQRDAAPTPKMDRQQQYSKNYASMGPLERQQNAQFDAALEQRLNRPFRQAEPDERGDRISTPYNPISAAQQVQAQDIAQKQARQAVLDRDYTPEMTAETVLRDTLAGAQKIGPTAFKSFTDLASMATAGHVGRDTGKALDAYMKWIDQDIGSDRAQAQARNFARDMADDNVDFMDALANNPGALLDQLLPTVGSMALPIAAAGVAGKVAQMGRFAKGMESAALAARVGRVQEAAAIGATTLQNASDSFNKVLDKGGTLERAYLAAGITAPFTLAVGKLTSGGAENALAMRLFNRANAAGRVTAQEADRFFPALAGAMMKEGAQETVEQFGQTNAEAIATNETLTPQRLEKEVAVAATLGAAMGGGMHAFTSAPQAPRVQDQPTTPVVPTGPSAPTTPTAPVGAPAGGTPVDQLAAILQREGLAPAASPAPEAMQPEPVQPAVQPVAEPVTQPAAQPATPEPVQTAEPPPVQEVVSAAQAAAQPAPAVATPQPPNQADAGHESAQNTAQVRDGWSSDATNNVANDGAPSVDPGGQQVTYTERTVHEIPVAQLTLSREVPQFKEGADANGVTQEARLNGTFDRRLAAPVQVWQRNDGSLEVISGRHRLDLAQRNGEDTIPAQVYREADGFGAEQARQLDVELNVKDGRGKVKDYVSYFREFGLSKDAAKADGLLNTAVGRAAYAIATDGGPTLVAAHAANAVTDEAAVAVAQTAPGNEALQGLGLRYLRDGRPINFAVNVMRSAQAAGFKGGDSADMFGFDDSYAKEAEAVSREATRQQTQARQQLAAITGAAKRPEMARAGGVEVADPQATQSRIEALRQKVADLEGFATNPQVYQRLRQDAGLTAPTQIQAGAQVNGQDGAVLSRYTASDVLNRQDAQAQAERQQQEAQREQDQRAQADAQRDEFALTGSDRAADANPDQQGLMFSRGAPTKSKFESRIDALFSGEKATTGTRVLDRSDVMGLLGHPDVPLMLNERHLIDGLTNHPELTAQAWKKVPEWLEQPAAVYTDPSHPGRLMVIAPELLAGRPVLMAVEPNAGHPLRGAGGGNSQEQLLVTVFAKTTGELPSLGGLSRFGRLQYADTKTAPVVWPRAGDIPRAGGLPSGAKRILTERNLAGWRKANAPKYSFAGRNAATANIATLEQAQQRTQAGEDAEAVRQNTGWHQGVDGEWRFEISDKEAALTITRPTPQQLKDVHGSWINTHDFAAKYPNTPEGKAIHTLSKMRSGKLDAKTPTLDMVIEHPALFAAYPWLSDIRVAIDDTRPIGSGAFSQPNNAIVMSPMNDDKFKSVLLHEIQHAIQEREGFASGGSPSQFAGVDLASQLELDRINAKLNSGDYDMSEYYSLMRKKTDILNTAGTESPHGLYRRLAGEVEARNTQARMGMDDAQRSDTPPSQTQDVADADQIVRRGSGRSDLAPTVIGTPVSVIRRAIAQAYGVVLAKLEAKGLVTLAQTQDEAITAAAQARADKTGGDVEAIKRSMMDGVLNSVRGSFDQYNQIAAAFTEYAAAENSTQFKGTAAAAIDDVVRDVGEGRVEVVDTKLDAYHLYIGGEKVATMSLSPLSKTVEINTARMRADGSGKLVMHVALEWAFNNGYKLAANGGLTKINTFRFTESMLASALRHGTTSHLKPEVLDQGLTGWGRATDTERLILLLQRSYENTIDHTPSLDGASFDSQTGQVVDQAGNVLADEEINQRLGNDDAARSRGIGLATFKKALVIGSALQNDQNASRLAQALVSQGNIAKVPHILYSANGAIQGFYDAQTGQSFLIADNLNEQTAPGVLMHEVGVHMAADGALAAVFDRAQQLLGLSRGNAFMDGVRQRLSDAGETSAEEAAAYIVEAYENDRANAPASVARWVKDFMASVRAWMFKHKILIKADGLSVADLAAIARANAKSLASGGRVEGEADVAMSQTSDDGGSVHFATAPQQQPAQPPAPRSAWKDSLGHLQFAPGKWLWDKMGAAAAPLLDRAYLRMPVPAVRHALRNMKLDIQRAMDTAGQVAGVVNTMPEDERAMVSDIIERELKAGVTPPAHAVQTAAMMSHAFDAQSSELVRLGMLSNEAATRWSGVYLPRFYEKHFGDTAESMWAALLAKTRKRQGVMQGIKGSHLKGRGMYQTIQTTELPAWQQQGWEVRDATFDPAKHDTVQVWRDFTRDEREQMGEIRDSGFRFVMGYMQTQKDIALGRMFESISQNPELASRTEQEGFVQVPDTTIPETGAKRYGKLAGLYVPRNVMSQLSGVHKTDNAALDLYRKALSQWKAFKTVYNPVAHVNNLVSNLTMAHFAGVSYWDAHKYAGAISDISKGAPMLKEARDAGLFLGSITDEELGKLLPPDLQLLLNQQDSKGMTGMKLAHTLLTWGLRRPAEAAYEFGDRFFKYMIFKDARAHGLDPQEAVDHAQKFIFNYDDLPQGARGIRDVALPFFSYTYKAIPALAETALTHPHRMIAPAAILHSMALAAYALAAGGDDEDQWEKIKRYVTDDEFRAKADKMREDEYELLPKWMKGVSALGTPKTIRLGTDEATQNPVFIDVSRFIPGGDLFDVHGNAGGVPWLQPLTPSNPLFSIYSAMFVNKDPFTGKPLTEDTDTRKEAAKKRAEWLWRQSTPAIAVSNQHWDRMVNAIAHANGDKEIPSLPEMFGGALTGIGKDGQPVQPKYAALNTFGIKARPQDLDMSEDIQKASKNKSLRELEAQLSQAKRMNRRGALSDRRLAVIEDAIDEKKQRLRDDLTVDGDEQR